MQERRLYGCTNFNFLTFHFLRDVSISDRPIIAGAHCADRFRWPTFSLSSNRLSPISAMDNEEGVGTARLNLDMMLGGG